MTFLSGLTLNDLFSPVGIVWSVDDGVDVGGCVANEYENIEDVIRRGDADRDGIDGLLWILDLVQCLHLRRRIHLQYLYQHSTGWSHDCINTVT